MGQQKQKLQELVEAEGKKFKCPECGTYTLEIWTESAAYCNNGIHTIKDSRVIEQILEDDDFDGYYDVDLTGMI